MGLVGLVELVGLVRRLGMLYGWEICKRDNNISMNGYMCVYVMSPGFHLAVLL